MDCNAAKVAGIADHSVTQYTAAEMREMANRLERKAKSRRISEKELRKSGHSNGGSYLSLTKKLETSSAMLRQAADAMDRQKALDELASESQRLGLYDVQRPTPPAKD